MCDMIDDVAEGLAIASPVSVEALQVKGGEVSVMTPSDLMANVHRAVTASLLVHGEEATRAAWDKIKHATVTAPARAIRETAIAAAAKAASANEQPLES